MNKTFKLSATFFVIVFVTLLVFEGISNKENSSFLQKIDSEGEVVVRAQPIVSKSGMEIMISMDTHTVDLKEGLKGVSYVESNGYRYSPVKWVGDPPGGHHRSGSLFFKDEFTNFTLYIESIGGENKKFNWR